jgi:hypothetical protein
MGSAALLGSMAGTARGAAVLTRHPYPQSVGQDRATIMWRTASAVAQSVDCGVDGNFFLLYDEAAPTTHHEVTLTGLAPGQKYCYRIREGTEIVVSDPAKYWFKTDPGRSGTTYSFFFTGDIGAELPDGKQALTQAMIRNVSPRADFGLLCGDIVYPDGESAAYDPQLMSIWKDLLCNTPVWPALGNHDWHVDPDLNFRQEWCLPNNEHYYSFDYGNGHFVALDTADGFLYDEANQLAWLREDLRHAHGRAQWTFVYYHHPILTCTYKGDIPEISALLFPIFEEFQVDFVFNGHAHTYERLYPIHGGVAVDQAQNPAYTDPQGTIYIISGAGAKVKRGEPTSFCGPTAAFADERILFTQVFVFDRQVYVLTFDSTTGQVVDAVMVKKTQAVTDAAPAPHIQLLHQNVPNPFNPTTTIPFEVASPSRVLLRVYRPDGRLVADVADAFYPAGSHRVVWNGRDAAGVRVPSGAYLARMVTDGGAWSIKMLLVR